MTVSVITPSFNSARYIAETMRTVAEQRTPSLRVEHIVMDGGSTDETAEVVARYAHPDTRFVSNPDGGPADALNKGFALASGDYVCWLNSDDFYYPGALERAVATLEAKPNKAFCFGHCPIVDENGREIRRGVTFFKEFWYPISCRPIIRTLNYISQPAMLIRRSALDKAGFLRTDLHAAWDYDLTLRLWRQGGALRLGRPAMACFRWTPHSISGRGFERQFAEELSIAIEDAGRFAPSAIIHRFVSRGIVFCYGRMAAERRGE